MYDKVININDYVKRLCKAIEESCGIVSGRVWEVVVGWCRSLEIDRVKAALCYPSGKIKSLTMLAIFNHRTTIPSQA